MAEQAKTETVEQGRAGRLAPFVVEFGTKLNQTVFISTLQQKVRGHYSLVKLMAGGGRGDVGAANRIPELPGLRMMVHPGRRRIRIYDPLGEDPEGKELLDRFNRVARSIPAIWTGEKRSAVPAIESELTPDDFKTLMIELVRKHEGGQIHAVVEGSLPTREQAEALPGREKYDVCNSGENRPKYRDEVAEWNERNRY